MTRINSRFVLAMVALGTFAFLLITVPKVQAQSVDPEATQTLKRMLDYLSGLKQFSVHTQNTLEDTLDSGQQIDIDISTSIIITRPNKLRAERKGQLLDQMFIYNGEKLTLFNPSDKVFATESAPASIEEMLDYTRESLGLIIPAADLIYRNAYPLLMQNVTSAIVVGKTVIDDVVCTHLVFSRPDVDFQVWVADGEQPLPCKYVVTDTSTPAMISTTTFASDWNVAPAIDQNSFNFAAPNGARKITFMPLETHIGGQTKEPGVSK